MSPNPPLPSLDRLRELFPGIDGFDKPLDSPVNLVAVVYHTIDHQVTFEEGDTYSTDYAPLVSTVIGCGFAGLAPPGP